ncbi:MAG: phosphomethylpyrimidine synthase ThiC [Tissierellia bacterium]|nr:phosphomethylpyrimidine synthase ThiC [Tissierellia bacterium]
MDIMTQLSQAKAGIITDAMVEVAKQENVTPEYIRDEVAAGRVVIPANIKHTSLVPAGIGAKLKTKINVNLGTSGDCEDISMEMKKVQKAIEMGADAIMDLSSVGDTIAFRRDLIEISPAMIGTVPIYDAVIHYRKPLGVITAKEWMDVVRLHAEEGVDFMTIHCGLNKNTAEKIKNRHRLTNIVSRGGSIIFAWMEMTGNENPFYENFDELLDICYEYDVTLSLGDACRPGSIADATDAVQIEELINLGELTLRAREKGVQVMIEGPGHMPLDQIAANMKIQETLCHGAPFYVLGPLVTDIAPGYDHITSAIGGAVAAASGAAFLCYVTPAEHLRLPDEKDMEEGIIASKIAAHAADIAKKIPGAVDRDHAMSSARKRLDWEEMFSLAIDPHKPRRYREESVPAKEDTCTMCGNFCAVRNTNRILDGEIVSIFEE